MLSSFSIISLIGVLLGVLVLVVVMAVYAGLERDVKARLLAFTPHVLLRYHDPATGAIAPVGNWREASEGLNSIPGVESTVPFVGDNVIIDYNSVQKPIMIRAIDTEDKGQVDGIAKLLDKDHYPNSSADMGLDDRIVISSTLAEDLGIGVNDVVRLYSTRNFEQVLAAYKSTENGPVREQFAGDWKTVNTLLRDGWKQSGGNEVIPVDAFREAFGLLGAISDKPIRKPEYDIIQTIMAAMGEAERDEGKSLYVTDAKTREIITKALDELAATDAEKMDATILKDLKEVVLPKDATVIGVYQSSQMTLTPDVFMPLSLSQTLSGLGDGVQGISVRLHEPYMAPAIAAQLSAKMGRQWETVTWMEQYQGFFALINQQRVMMYFALSFIVLVSAFSMMAVMFTVTIQKRREIGVMKALGATSGQIVRVFLYQGMILGVFGSVLGLLLGRLVIHYRGGVQAFLRSVNFDPFSSSFTGFTVLPAHNDLKEQIIITFAAFVLCSVAALVPAAFAARSDAAKSLRNL